MDLKRGAHGIEELGMSLITESWMVWGPFYPRPFWDSMKDPKAELQPNAVAQSQNDSLEISVKRAGVNLLESQS